MMERAPIATSVDAALRLSGGRNAGTPFETASTPVIAVHPFEKAVRSANVVSRPVAVAGCSSSWGCDGAREVPPRAKAEHPQHADDEEVGGHGKDTPGFAYPAQVADHDDGNEPEPDLDAVRHPLRKGRRECRDARSHADSHRQHVVDQQRGRRNQAGERPEVLFRDDVGATAARIRVDRLSIREDDDGQRDGDDDANRRDEAQGCDTADEQHAEDFLRRVGDRGERVRREHRQSGHTGQALVMSLVRRDGRAHEDALQLEQERFVGHSKPPIADGVS